MNVEVPVPPGFSTTSYAFNKFLDENKIREKIENAVKNINVESVLDLKTNSVFSNYSTHQDILDSIENPTSGSRNRENMKYKYQNNYYNYYSS